MLFAREYPRTTRPAAGHQLVCFWLHRDTDGCTVPKGYVDITRDPRTFLIAGQQHAIVDYVLIIETNNHAVTRHNHSNLRDAVTEFHLQMTTVYTAKIVCQTGHAACLMFVKQPSVTSIQPVVYAQLEYQLYYKFRPYAFKNLRYNSNESWNRNAKC